MAWSPPEVRSPGLTDSLLHRSRHVRLMALLGALVVLLAACVSAEATPPTTNPTVTTTTTPVTTTTAPVTTSTTAPTTTAPVDTNSLAEGSGCTPGTADSLPDGEWFGLVDEAAAEEIDFDLACWFSGDAAARAAAEDGQESPPPNDYYVRNVNPTLRTLSVADDASVTWLPSPGDPATEETVSYSDWLDGRQARDFQPGVWLTIEDGAIVDIREQYVP